MSKKILSFALAVVMLISVFACSASAVDLTSGEYAYRMTTDAYVNQEVGTTVKAYLYFDYASDIDFNTYRQGLGNTAIGYNGDYFTCTGYEWCEPYSGYFADKTLNTGIFGNFTLSANDTANGYTKGFLFNMGYDTEKQTDYTSKTGFPIVEHAPIACFEFEVIKKLDDTAKIGIVEGAYNKQMKFNYFTTKNNTVALAKLDLTQAVTNPHVVTINEAANIKVRPNAADATKMDIGFTGEFTNSSFEVAFKQNGWTCDNLTEVGFDAKVNGVSQKATDNFIYPTDNGYKFRAVLSGVTADTKDAKIECRMYITTTNGTYYSDWLYITPDAAHTTGVGNGMTAIF